MDGFLKAACSAAALILGACGGSGSHASGPTPATRAKDSAVRSAAPTPQTTTTALFQPRQGILPYPTDLYFAGSADGTLNVPPDGALTPASSAVNMLDGFSTTAAIRARFGGTLDPASLTAQSVIVLQVTIDNTTKATTHVVRPLVFGVDYTTRVTGEPGVGNSILEIRPTHPLVPSTGSTNNGYLVLLTNRIMDGNGKRTTSDRDYAEITAAVPACTAITDDLLDAACHAVAAHLHIATTVGVSPADVVLSFSFTTQSISDSLAAVERMATPQPLVVHNTGLTTAQVDSRLSGHATIHVGTLTLPYYLSRTAPLTGYWQGNPSALNASSRLLTRFNPMPVPTETLRIPVLVTVPNANSAAGATKPANGWPIVIFAHGINRNRTDALAVADSFADSGLVVIAIDLPLHGVTDPASPLYASGANSLYSGLLPPASGSIERTFDLDVVNNITGAPGSDGKIDPSGASFVNAANVSTLRDNLREGAADLITLARSLPALSLDDDPSGDIDPTSVHFLGHSLGAMVGTLFLGVVSNSEVDTATLAMPGGGLPYLLSDSPTLGPRLAAALGTRGLTPGTPLFDRYLRDSQTVIDSGDPLNYIATAAANHPIHLFQIVGSTTSPPDQVVPNSATQRLIDAANLARIPAAPAPGSHPSDASGYRTYVNFVIGDHGSLFDPTASMAVTTEMQAEAIAFTGAPVPPIPPLSFPGLTATPAGTTLLLLNPAVLQP